MENIVLVLGLVLLSGQACIAIQVTSTSSLRNGTVVPACSGQDVTLAWSYTAEAQEHLMNVEWYYAPTGGDASVLATQVMGSFLAAPTASQHVQFIPNAGIRLQNVAAADAGTYSVHINVNLHGSVITVVQSVVLQVSDSSLTTDGLLHVEMLPEAVYDNSTQQYHVQLACGHFKPVWSTRANVVWRTPSGQTLPSTSFVNGRFLLSVPNPLASGEYTCTIDPNSPASLCVQSDSPLYRGATGSVDGTDARFAVMEAKMKLLQMEKEQLKTEYQQETSALHQEIRDLRQQLEEHMVNTSASRASATPDVSFYADMSSRQAITNEGNALDLSTGQFTVPVHGTYVFLADAYDDDDLRREFYIAVDHTYVTTCRIFQTDTVNGQGHCHAVLKLTAGQIVTLEHIAYSGFHAHQVFFSGALLHAE